jgi:hypothetical protein
MRTTRSPSLEIKLNKDKANNGTTHNMLKMGHSCLQVFYLVDQFELKLISVMSPPLSSEDARENCGGISTVKYPIDVVDGLMRTRTMDITVRHISRMDSHKHLPNREH